MKVCTFEKGKRIAVGLVAERKNKVIDLNAAYAMYLKEEENEPEPIETANIGIPPDMLCCIQRREKSFLLIRRMKNFIDDLLSRQMDLPKSPSGLTTMYNLDQVRLKAPIPRPPVIGIGQFNAEGIIEEASRTETGEAKKSKEGIQQEVVYPREATIVWGHPSTVIGPDDSIVFPKIAKTLYNSIELGIIIGKDAYQVLREKANEYILGYTVTTDITAFDLVQKENFVYTETRCKNMPTFWPMGPWITLASQINDPMNLEYVVRINGKVAMNGNTGEYIYDPLDYIHDVSKYIHIEAGTVIAAGAFLKTTYTFIKPGDVVENEIEGIGVLKNSVIAEK